MKNMFSNAKKKIVGAAVAVGAVSANAAQAMDTSTINFNTDDAAAVGLLVLTAIAVLWGVRKAISFGNRG